MIKGSLILKLFVENSHNINHKKVLATGFIQILNNLLKSKFAYWQQSCTVSKI